ncbi:MAG: n-acetylglutamate synthase [archaeon]|nr:n-acetylglutamate synthase [archaeon]
MIDLNNKVFKSTSNSNNGEISDDTIFNYHQSGKIVWAEYVGGVIIKGTLIGKFIGNDNFEFVYQHLNEKNELLTGKCTSNIEIDENAKIILNENWQWTCRDYSKGKSKLIEI